MSVQRVTFVCAVLVVGDVALATPITIETEIEAPVATIDTDGAEIIETTGEVVS